MKHAYLVDPEIRPEVVRRLLPEPDPVVTVYNPLHDLALAAHEIHPADPPPYRELRREYDRIQVTLAEASYDGVARTVIRALDEMHVDLSAILQAGWGTEVHVCLHDHLRDLDAESVTVVSQRAIFEEVALLVLGGRGTKVQVSRTSRPAPPVSTEPLSRRLASLARMAGRWMASSPRVLVSEHRQTTPIRAELESHDVAVGNQSLLALLRRPSDHLTTVSAEDLACARDALQRLRSYGEARLDGVAAAGWQSLLDSFEPKIASTLTAVARDLLSLDLLRPDLVVAPNWAGWQNHTLRAWTWARGVPFVVVQHGMNLGSRVCPVTGIMGADVFYAWGERYMNEWIDLERNAHTEVVPIGNPVYDGVNRKTVGDVRAIMLGPAGMLDFGRSGLIDFWRAGFAIAETERLPVRWKARDHAMGRNTAWVKEQGSRVGCVWSGDEPLVEALHDVDILVTMPGSLAVDAMVRGIIVVVVNHIDHEPLFLPEVAGVYLTDLDDLEAALTDLVESPAARARALARQRWAVENYPTAGVASRAARDLMRRVS